MNDNSNNKITRKGLGKCNGRGQPSSNPPKSNTKSFVVATPLSTEKMLKNPPDLPGLFSIGTVIVANMVLSSVRGHLKILIKNFLSHFQYVYCNSLNITYHYLDRHFFCVDTGEKN